MGGKIVCCDRKEEELKKTVEGIRDLGGEIEYRIADMTKKDEVDAVAKLAVEKYGRIDILLNNAGTMPLSFFSDHERLGRPGMTALIRILRELSMESALYMTR